MTWWLELRGNFSLTLYILYFTPKVQKNLSLCLIKHLAMETYWGVELYLHTLLTSALDGDEWAASLPCHFTPRETAPGTHWIESWAGPRVCLDTVVKRKISSPYVNSLTSNLQLSAIPLSCPSSLQIQIDCCIFFFGRTYYLSTNSIHVKFVGNNLKV